MQKYLSMILFVVVMGAVSVGVLVGADIITRDLIAKNAEFVWKDAMLNHHEIAHTPSDFSEIFDESFDVEEGTHPDTDQTLYVYYGKDDGRISFRFKGNGLWGPIEGVITLEPDFVTIVAITVTKHEETPGLGGIVAERQYLNKYVGKTFDESLGLVAVKDVADQDYEVDAITGATGTSNAFVGLLSVNYRVFYNLFSGEDVDAVWKKLLLDHNGVAYTDTNYNQLFDSGFSIDTHENLVLYTHISSGNVSFRFSTNGFNGTIDAIITLESDFETIIKINVLSQSEGWGAAIQTNPSVLAAFVGKKFDPTISVVASPSAPNEVLDGFGGATTTKAQFQVGLNAAYQNYYAAFVDGDYVPPTPTDTTKIWKQEMLLNNDIASNDENYDTLFSENFDVETSGALTLYVHKVTGTLNFLFEGQGEFSIIKSVLTLNADFVTIVKVSVYEHDEKWGAKIKNDTTILAAFVGKKFDPIIVLVDSPLADNEVLDGLSGVTGTKNGFMTSLNSTYQAYFDAFGNGE